MLFGEEVIISNTDQALSRTIHELGLHVKEYTVAPCYLNDRDKGYHEWLIEFEHNPSDLTYFETTLDNNLRSLNSDYDAKRFKNMALQNLKVHMAPKGLFHQWLKNNNKLGGQYKIPRLYNDRTYLERYFKNENIDRK